MFFRLLDRLYTLNPTLDDVGPPVVVATHPRSGTHLTIDLLRKQFEELKSWVWFGETLHHLYLNIDRLRPDTSHPLSIPEVLRILQRPTRPTLKTHSLPDFRSFERNDRPLVQALVEKGTVLYVVRDGRDVLCSAYLWKQTHGNSACSLSAFLRGESGTESRVGKWVEHVRQWLDRDDAHVLKFESILRDPESVVRKLGDILDAEPIHERPYLPRRVSTDSRWNDYWRRLTRDYESTTIVARPNGQQPPDWRSAFTKEDRRYFAAIAGGILREFGYETDDSWI